MDDSIRAAKETMDDFAKDKAAAEAIGQRVHSIENETRLIGLTNNERVRQNDLMQLEEQRSRLSSDAFKHQTEVLMNMRAQQEEMNQVWQVGAGQALRQYVEDTKNMGKQAADLVVGEFQRMEDAIINWVKTGKLNVTDLADFIITEMLRMATRALLLAPLARSLEASFPALGFSSMFGLGGGATAGTNAFPGTSGTFLQNSGVATYATGTDYVPKNMLAYIHKGEAVIDAKTNAGGGRGIRIVYAPVTHIDSRTDRAEVAMLVDRRVKQGQVELVDQMQRAGVIA